MARRMTDVKKLDDGFAQYLLCIKCTCGNVRVIEPKAMAAITGWKITLEKIGELARCSKCEKKGGMDVYAESAPLPRGHSKYPR